MRGGYLERETQVVFLKPQNEAVAGNSPYGSFGFHILAIL